MEKEKGIKYENTQTDCSVRFCFCFLFKLFYTQQHWIEKPVQFREKKKQHQREDTQKSYRVGYIRLCNITSRKCAPTNKQNRKKSSKTAKWHIVNGQRWARSYLCHRFLPLRALITHRVIECVCILLKGFFSYVSLLFWTFELFSVDWNHQVFQDKSTPWNYCVSRNKIAFF